MGKGNSSTSVIDSTNDFSENTAESGALTRTSTTCGSNMEVGFRRLNGNEYQNLRMS
jgi:hypothetical protein